MTANLMRERFEELGSPTVEITEVDDFYLARWQVYIEELSHRLTDSKSETVMVLGHCPGVEDLVEALTGQWVTMPTAAIGRITCDLESWAALETLQRKDYRRHFRLVDLWLPREVLS